jgi:hypothetical protein
MPSSGLGTIAAKVRVVRVGCLFLGVGAVAVSACSSPSTPTPDADLPADSAVASAEIGVPGGSDGLDFAPFERGGELRLQTLGQGGTHVFLAVRTVGFGNRAFVTLTLRNLTTGKEIQSPAPPRPQLLFCDDAQLVCDLVPLTVMMGGITEPEEERHGLHVAIQAEVHNEAGAQAFADHEAVLSTEDL